MHFVSQRFLKLVALRHENIGIGGTRPSQRLCRPIPPDI
jgi:hypothetical protein